jgi:hypothetical protein
MSSSSRLDDERYSRLDDERESRSSCERLDDASERSSFELELGRSERNIRGNHQNRERHRASDGGTDGRKRAVATDAVATEGRGGAQGRGGEGTRYDASSRRGQ